MQLCTFYKEKMAALFFLNPAWLENTCVSVSHVQVIKHWHFNPSAPLSFQRSQCVSKVANFSPSPTLRRCPRNQVNRTESLTPFLHKPVCFFLRTTQTHRSGSKAFLTQQLTSAKPVDGVITTTSPQRSPLQEKHEMFKISIQSQITAAEYSI